MELQDAYADIRAQGAELVAISVDDIAGAQRMREHASAEFPVLSDADASVTRRYGVFDLLDDGVAAPATFVLDDSLRIVAGAVGNAIGDRVPAQVIINTLRELRSDQA
ncbi:MAG: redoxin domain-containing protein [Dehalococcoidia bacterium]|nr:redoxin domain-containing protein [Dehalococcoidia bacterium]